MLSVGGNVCIDRKVIGPFFKFFGINEPIKFYVLPSLETFDGIIGDDTLKELGAVVDRKENVLVLKNSFVIPLKEKITAESNYILGEEYVPEVRTRIEGLINKYKPLFGPLDGSELASTNIQAEIRTSTEEPIYTKSYPYPICMREEVERQVKELLSEGIIRPSKSPYNSPIWVVPKKPKPNGERQYRMVVDFKRLNAVTIPDTYPIPDITSTLASLGKAKYFTTIDLTSGFHQVAMKPKDIPKTAFSTANGKFEYLRLPFGLKNAPAIFQRMIDDVLHEYIGKICFVYIDDVIVIGESFESHLRNVDTIFARLREANLKVNLDKTHFMKTEVEFLGYIVGTEGIRPDPAKVKSIENLLPPTNLKELKSFLGMTSYYRRFIRDYAKVAKPLTNLTRGEHAQIKASQSRKVPINLNNESLKSFSRLKSMLTTAELLAFPDFGKPFNLTTDASNTALGAVLSQGEIGKDKPIAYISRSLNKTEENYATNEKEMLAIVWALDNLRNYLYGAKKIKIYTDHQPLTFALGNRNFNAKLKRWKARIEEYSHELIYKPGKSNYVADALSRLKTVSNHLYHSSTDTASEGMAMNSYETSTASEGREDDDLSSTETVHSAEQDASELIPHVEVPINVFRRQIIIGIGLDVTAMEEPHRGYTRHFISSKNWTKEELVTLLKEKLHPNILNGVKVPESLLGVIQEIYIDHFSKYKVRITQKLVTDITSKERQFEIIETEHRRAHRNPRENGEQILEQFYFPHMRASIRKYVASCDVCNRCKYDRKPPQIHRQDTPDPKYPCEILHMDIMEIQGQKFITCIDKFTKFAKFFSIRDRSLVQVRKKLIKILHYYTVPKILVTDNERSFVSPLVETFIKSLGIKLYLTPVQRSEVNGQVERLHSTIIEIYRCLRVEYPNLSVKELIEICVDRYNNTIHSTTKKRPRDLFFNRNIGANYENLLSIQNKINTDLRHLLKRNMGVRKARMNRRRQSPKKYRKGDRIYVAIKTIQGKNKALYRKEIVEKDNRVTVLTRSGRKIHKEHIKNLNEHTPKKNIVL